MKKLGIAIFYDIVGSFLFAVGIYTFAYNANFAPGGLYGIALLINHFISIPLGTITLLFNIPIGIICYKYMGRAFLLNSIRSMTIAAFFTDVVMPKIPTYSGSPLLAAIFMGLCAGGGLSLIYMQNSSTGGSDFVILMLRKRHPHLSVGQITLITDGAVILTGGFVFKNVDAVLFGIISSVTATTVMDKIMFGSKSGALAMIVTPLGHAVAQAIDNTVGRGSTRIRVIGSYTKQIKEMVICACSKKQIASIRHTIKSIDPDALIIVTESKEVFGEGFEKIDTY